MLAAAISVQAAQSVEKIKFAIAAKSMGYLLLRLYIAHATYASED
jgi:hypothetical protein